MENDPYSDHELNVQEEPIHSENSDGSCPPGFEFLKHQSPCSKQVPTVSSNSKCSTTFARFSKKDYKGHSMLFEIN